MLRNKYIRSWLHKLYWSVQTNLFKERIRCMLYMPKRPKIYQIDSRNYEAILINNANFVITICMSLNLFVIHMRLKIICSPSKYLWHILSTLHIYLCINFLQNIILCTAYLILNFHLIHIKYIYPWLFKPHLIEKEAVDHN